MNLSLQKNRDKLLCTYSEVFVGFLLGIITGIILAWMI
jgi:ABC-type nitrate/sulfonate/bicarbonate transport system permease component